MKKLLDAFALLENEKQEEAYEAFTKILDDKKIGVDARYSRAMLDISKLKKFTENTIEDLLYLIDKITKYKDVSYSFLTFVYDDIQNIQNVIKYAKLALEHSTPFPAEINFALARALVRFSTTAYLNDALKAINESLKYESADEYMDFIICKVDILISLNQFNEAEESIDRLIREYSYGAVTYYLKARLALAKYFSTKDINLLDDVVRNAMVCLEYDDDQYMVKIMLIEAYTILKEFDKALKIIDSMKTVENEEDIILEKIKVYDAAKEYETALSIVREYLKTNESWKLKYMEGALSVDSDDANAPYCIKCFKEAYNMSNKSDIIYDIIKLNRRINNEQDTFDFIKTILDKEVDLGFLYFNLADLAIRLSRSYEEIIEYYTLSYKNGYLEEQEYYNAICNYTKDPNQYSKEIKKLEKLNHKIKDAWSLRKTAIRYIYKEDGYRQNLNKAYELLLKCKNNLEDSCTNAILGRALELKKKMNLAFRYYESGYNIIKLEEYPECTCAYGYYAHAYFNGIGCKKDIDIAKSIILEAIKKEPRYTCSHIVYYYAYFFLKGNEEFDGEFAQKLLENNYPFYRHDISRIVLLSQVIKKRNTKSQKLNELLTEISVYSKEDIKYFNENINKDISLPFWRNI